MRDATFQSPVVARHNPPERATLTVLDVLTEIDPNPDFSNSATNARAVKKFRCSGGARNRGLGRSD